MATLTDARAREAREESSLLEFAVLLEQSQIAANELGSCVSAGVARAVREDYLTVLVVAAAIRRALGMLALTPYG